MILIPCSLPLLFDRIWSSGQRAWSTCPSICPCLCSSWVYRSSYMECCCMISSYMYGSSFLLLVLGCSFCLEECLTVCLLVVLILFVSQFQIPNGIGTILGIIQLLLYAYFRKGSREEAKLPLLVTHTWACQRTRFGTPFTVIFPLSFFPGLACGYLCTRTFKWCSRGAV